MLLFVVARPHCTRKLTHVKRARDYPPMRTGEPETFTGVKEGLALVTMAATRYIGTAELAQRWAISRQAIKQRVDRGAMPPGELIGRTRFWTLDEIEEYERVHLEQASDQKEGLTQ